MRISPPSWSIITSGVPRSASCSRVASRFAWAGPVRLSRNRIAPAARPLAEHLAHVAGDAGAGEAQHHQAPDLLGERHLLGHLAGDLLGRRGGRGRGGARTTARRRPRRRSRRRRRTRPRPPRAAPSSLGARWRAAARPPCASGSSVMLRCGRRLLARRRANVSAKTTGGKGSHEGTGPHHRAAQRQRRQDRAPGRARLRARVHDEELKRVEASTCAASASTSVS